jgi:peptidylprolyl isomerase domain and WD repeat-containing protein 1
MLEHEATFLGALPSAEMYERSYMHRDTITHVVREMAAVRRQCVGQASELKTQIVTARTDFFVTGSVDGHLKFWKKSSEGVEFVKHFRSHPGPVVDLAGKFPARRRFSRR